jgi:hypothetical protein
MSKFTYSPIDHGGSCASPRDGDEKEYPSVHLDIGPEQLKGLDAGQDVEITIRGKLKSLRYDTDDNWGTGASVSVSLRSCEVKDSEEQSVIDSMLEED